VKKGENDLPGLTDTEKPRMRGPKRASKIRKLFNLSKEDDVRKYVNTYRRTFTTKAGTVACLITYIYINVFFFFFGVGGLGLKEIHANLFYLFDISDFKHKV
jgi:hypothetical protein